MRTNFLDFSAPARVLRNRNFALYTAGNSVSLIGMWTQRLAVGWLVWELTESGLWLGAVAMAEFIPTLLLTPVSGVVADRFDRRSIAIIGQCLTCLQAIVLCVLTAMGMITPELIIVLTLLASVVIAFNQTARLTLVPMMVPREHLTSALAITSVIFNLARFVGPGLAGVIIKFWGAAFAFGFNALSYVTIIVALLAIEMPRYRRDTAEDNSFLTELMDGYRYVLNHRSITTLLILLSVGALLARPVVELLAGFVGTVFMGDATEFAILNAALGFGAIFSGLWLAGKGDIKGLTTITIYAVFLNAVAITLFAATGIFWLAVVALAISGFAQVASGTGSQTLIQTVVADHMRGRVLSVWALIMRGVPALGALGFGWLAEYFGFSWPIAIGSLLAAAFALVVARKRSQLQQQFERT